jgi:hypothetical protein
MMMMMITTMIIITPQDTNFYTELVIVKSDMLVSDYGIGDSFRIFWTSQIFQLMHRNIHFYLSCRSITLMITYQWM